MKSYTDLDQSRKLAEILPIETADMWYPDSENRNHIEFGFDATRQQMYIDYKDGLPCWSLAALISILPYGCLTIHVQKKYRVISNPNCITEGDYNNPVDPCVEMILKLHEQNLL